MDIIYEWAPLVLYAELCQWFWRCKVAQLCDLGQDVIVGSEAWRQLERLGRFCSCERVPETWVLTVKSEFLRWKRPRVSSNEDKWRHFLPDWQAKMTSLRSSTSRFWQMRDMQKLPIVMMQFCVATLHGREVPPPHFNKIYMRLADMVRTFDLRSKCSVW